MPDRPSSNAEQQARIDHVRQIMLPRVQVFRSIIRDLRYCSLVLNSGKLKETESGSDSFDSLSLSPSNLAIVWKLLEESDEAEAVLQDDELDGGHVARIVESSFSAKGIDEGAIGSKYSLDREAKRVTIQLDALLSDDYKIHLPENYNLASLCSALYGNSEQQEALDRLKQIDSQNPTRAIGSCSLLLQLGFNRMSNLMYQCLEARIILANGVGLAVQYSDDLDMEESTSSEPKNEIIDLVLRRVGGLIEANRMEVARLYGMVKEARRQRI